MLQDTDVLQTGREVQFCHRHRAVQLSSQTRAEHILDHSVMQRHEWKKKMLKKNSYRKNVSGFILFAKNTYKNEHTFK